MYLINQFVYPEAKLSLGIPNTEELLGYIQRIEMPGYILHVRAANIIKLTRCLLFHAVQMCVGLYCMSVCVPVCVGMADVNEKTKHYYTRALLQLYYSATLYSSTTY